MFATVARSGTDSVPTPGPVNSSSAPTTPAARSSRVTVSARSVAVAGGRSAPRSRTPTISGTGSHTAPPSATPTASTPPTPQPSTPSPLTIGVCESVPSTKSYAEQVRPARVRADHPGQHLQVDLVHDAAPGRHDPQPGERAGRPLEEAEALGVVGELVRHVGGQRARPAAGLHLDAVVDDEVDRQGQVQRRRRDAELGGGPAGRGDVGEHRDAAVVLQQQPARPDPQPGPGPGRGRRRVEHLLGLGERLVPAGRLGGAQDVLRQQHGGARRGRGAAQAGAGDVDVPDRAARPVRSATRSLIDRALVSGCAHPGRDRGHRPGAGRRGAPACAR